MSVGCRSENSPLPLPKKPAYAEDRLKTGEGTVYTTVDLLIERTQQRYALVGVEYESGEVVFVWKYRG